MADWGISSAGFYCPTYDEILAEKIASAEELFGSDVSTSALTPLGKFLRIEAKADARLYESIEAVYYAASPATAIGVSLDRLVSFAGIKRKTATAAIHILHVYSETENYEIAAGTEFRTSAGVVFRSLADAAASIEDTEGDDEEDETGTYYAEARVQCTTLGTGGNVSTINQLVIADVNISSISYAGCESEGEDTETDAELYARYLATVDGLGTNTAASVKAAVLSISGVQSCVVLSESTELELSADDAGYAVIVYTTSEDDATLLAIATAIFTNGAFGVPTVGTTSVVYTDTAGVAHTINFYLAETISAEVTVTYTKAATFPTDGEDLIAEGIEELFSELEISESFAVNALYEKIYSVGGVSAASVSVVAGGETYGSDGVIEAADNEIIILNNVTVTEA